MMEDFYVGMGSKIRPSEEEIDQMREDYEKSWKLALESSPKQGAMAALEQIKGADDLLKKGETDAVRRLLAQPIIITMGLQLAPKPKQKVEGPWAQCQNDGGECREALADARNSLQAVEEWCFSNRVEFFNSADQKQVEAISGGKGLDDRRKQILASISEPLEALASGRDALRQIAKAAKV